VRASIKTIMDCVSYYCSCNISAMSANRIFSAQTRDQNIQKKKCHHALRTMECARDRPLSPVRCLWGIWARLVGETIVLNGHIGFVPGTFHICNGFHDLLHNGHCGFIESKCGFWTMVRWTPEDLSIISCKGTRKREPKPLEKHYV
jgi:hypothetical protein